jgi:hypothetical protein
VAAEAAVSAAVFSQVFIPSTLDQVHHFERDIKLAQAGKSTDEVGFSSFYIFIYVLDSEGCLLRNTVTTG